MHKISRALIFLSLVAAFAFGVSPAEAQKVKCDPLPKVEWWSQSHAKVIATVDKRYKGDWEKYIARWEKYGSRMEKTLAAKSVAVVKSRGIKLRNDPELNAPQDNVSDDTVFFVEVVTFV